MELNEIYFYTASIKDWILLLRTDKFKHIVLDSLIFLVKNEKIRVYSFVIMPNHIHLIWENVSMNGKEKPYASFMKFTSHQFLAELRRYDHKHLERFKSDGLNRNYQFWQRDALPIRLYDRKILEQKLNYIHLNPLQEHWNLVGDPNHYYFSSCSFYEKNDEKFDWLTHYMDVI
jgi:putative transposase